MHLVLKRLSPNHTIKACTLDLVKENNLLSFISSIEQADIIRVGTKLDFEKIENSEVFFLFIKLVEEYLNTSIDNKTIKELNRIKGGYAGIVSNSTILKNAVKETKFKEIVELVKTYYNNIKIYFNSVTILTHFDTENNEFICKERTLINLNKGNIKIIPANHLIVATEKIETESYIELLDIDPYRCVGSVILNSKMPLLHLDQNNEMHSQVFEVFDNNSNYNDFDRLVTLLNISGQPDFIVKSQKDMLVKELFSRLTLATLYNGFYKE